MARNTYPSLASRDSIGAPEFIRWGDAQDILGVSWTWLYGKVQEGEIKPKHFLDHNAHVFSMFRRSDVLAYKAAIDANRPAVLDELATEGQERGECD